MSATVNRVELIGNLGADVVLRHTESGTPVVDMRLATNDSHRRADGKFVESTEWHTVVVWGKQAENCSKYLSKGRQIRVEGHLKTRKYVDKKTNQERQVTEVVAEKVTFLGSPRAMQE